MVNSILGMMKFADFPIAVSPWVRIVYKVSGIIGKKILLRQKKYLMRKLCNQSNFKTLIACIFGGQAW